MKKLSLIAALTLSTMLSACGGGGGGGHSFLPPTIPDVTNPDNPGTNTPGKDADNTDITMMKTRVVKDKDGGFTNLVNDTLVAAYQEHEATSSMKKARLFAARANNNDYLSNTNICKSERDCNQEIFDNMKKILIDQNLANASAKELRDALILAGFKDDLAGMWDDVNELQKYIREHPDEIQAKTDEIYKNHTVTLENAKLNLVELTESNQDSYINFTLKDDKIDSIKVSKDSNSASSHQYAFARQNDENKFEKKQTIYQYGINLPQYSGTLFETNEKLSNDEIKKRLIKRVDELAEAGVYDNGPGGTDAYIKKIKDAINSKDFAAGEMAPDGDYDLFFNTRERTETASYKSSAMDMKLAYSDFGILDITTKDSNKDNETYEKHVFAGGYENKKIDMHNINQEINFKGKAVGGVNYWDEENLVESSNPITKTLDLDGTADLTFNGSDGSQKLTAKFDNWYTVSLDKNIKENNGTLEFNADGKTIAEDFKFRGQDSYVVKNFIGDKEVSADGIKPENIGGVVGNAFGAADIGYYGDNNLPTEATGYVMYGESLPYKSGAVNNGNQDDYDRVKLLNMQFGFGAKRQ